MNTLQAIPFDQFIGHVTKYSEPRRLDAVPDGMFSYLLDNYYGQGTALLSVHGYNAWQAYVRNHLAAQGFKTNILRYNKPDLRAFAYQVGKKECLLMKYSNGKLLPESAPEPKMSEYSVDMRYYTDWLKAGNVRYSAVNEQTGSVFGTQGNDFVLQQHGSAYRVSNRIGNMWRRTELEWWSNGWGKVIEYPLLAEFIKKLPKTYKEEYKKIS